MSEQNPNQPFYKYAMNQPSHEDDMKKVKEMISEQRHTPYYYVDTQFGDRYCLMDGNDMSKNGAYRMLETIKRAPDLLAKVSEQQREIERLKKENLEAVQYYNKKLLEVEDRRVIVVSEQSQRIEALTKENEQLKQMMDVEHCQSLETCCKEAKRVEQLEGLLDEVLNDVQYADNKISEDLRKEIKAALNL